MTYRTLAASMLLAAAACAPEQAEQVDTEPFDAPETEQAAAPAGADQVIEIEMIDTAGTPIGTARLTPAGEGVQIALDASGLPAGEHGFHIHETGTCDPPDFESAGGHFNPTNQEHGFEDPQGPHAGDLRNITVEADGSVQTEATAELVSLAEGSNSLLQPGGTALMIHAGPDDYMTNPSGDSGARIACGMIAG